MFINSWLFRDEDSSLAWVNSIDRSGPEGQTSKPWTIWTHSALSPASINEKAVCAAYILWAEEWCQSRESDLAGCSWLEPRPFPTQCGDRTHCCASIWRCWPCLPHIHCLLLLSNFTSWFPGTWSCWLLACPVWQLPEHWDLKIGSKCLSPATTFQSIFRTNPPSLAPWETTLLFLFLNYFYSQFRLRSPHLGIQSLGFPVSAYQPRRRFCFQSIPLVKEEVRVDMIVSLRNRAKIVCTLMLLTFKNYFISIMKVT